MREGAEDVAELARGGHRRLRAGALGVLACSGACPSCPKSRRSAATWRPTSRGGCWRRWTCSTSAGAGRSRRRSSRTRCGAAAIERLVAARQVPRVGALRRRLPAHAPADDGHDAARPGPAAAATRACGSRSATTSWCSTIRAASGPASSRSGRRRSPRSSTRGSASSRSRASSPPSTCTCWRARSRAPVKAFLLDQKRVAGVGQHLRRRGAVPRARAPAAAGQPAHARAVRGVARRDRRVADGRAGGQGRDDRRLPRPVRRQRQLPGPVPRPPARARAVPELRQPGAQAARRRARDLRVRALPAAPARAPAPR